MNNNIWEDEVYKKNKKINKYPYISIVSNIYKYVNKGNNNKIKILDVGCGSGNHLKFLCENGFDVYGIDISQTAINISNNFLQKNNLKAKLSVCDSSKLFFENEYFDCLIDRASLTHNSFNYKKCIDEVYRVLKLDGIFITEIFGKKSSDKKYGEKINDNVYTNFYKGGFLNSSVYLIDYDEIKIIFKDFKILKIIKKYIINHGLNEIQYFEIILKK